MDDGASFLQVNGTEVPCSLSVQGQFGCEVEDGVAAADGRYSYRKKETEVPYTFAPAAGAAMPHSGGWHTGG